MLKIPASLSEECKNLIVSLLNRNPSKRLGAGPEGAEEIKRHPFFTTLDWSLIREKKLPNVKPEVNMRYFAAMQNYVECSDDQLKRVFDDPEDADSEVFENRTVQGWSFVQGTNSAGNQQ